MSATSTTATPASSTAAATAATPAAPATTDSLLGGNNTPATTESPAASTRPADTAAPPSSSGTPAAGAPTATPPAGTTETTTEPDPAAWPEDWVARAAKGDEKRAKRLSRYASPEAAMDALIAAQDKISSAQLKTPKPTDPAALKVWREDNGLPEDASGYDLTLDDGVVIGDADRPLVEKFLATAHDSDMSPAQVKKAVGWFLQEQENAQAEAYQARVNADAEAKVKTTAALREEYGEATTRNLLMVRNLLDGAGDGVRDNFLSARLPDGTPIGSDPATVRWLVGLSRELNPAGTVLPGLGDGAMQSMANEMAQLRGMMGDRKSAYWKGPDADKHQSRYRELIEATNRAKR